MAIAYTEFNRNWSRTMEGTGSKSRTCPRNSLFLCNFLYLHTYSIEQGPFEKLTDIQLVKKFPAFYGTRSFITAFTSARLLSLSWASSIQSIPPHPTSLRSILILPSHLRLGLPSGPFHSGFPTKILYTPLPSLMRYMPRPSHSSRFYHPNNIG